MQHIWNGTESDFARSGNLMYVCMYVFIYVQDIFILMKTSVYTTKTEHTI